MVDSTSFLAHPVSEQVLSHLRDGIRQGRWRDLMPGRERLATELGVSAWSVQYGLDVLEKEGMLVNEGEKRRRRIVLEGKKLEPKRIRIGMLLYEDTDRKVDFLVDLRHRLQEMGHVAEFAEKSLLDLKNDGKRVADFVKANPADAWVVVSGSFDIMTWFSQQPVPVFALFGRLVKKTLATASTRKEPALIEAIEHLTGLGHRRISLITSIERRTRPLGTFERLYLQELEGRGIPVTPDSIPDWSDDVAGLHQLVDRLFVSAAPTALMISQPFQFIAIRSHLAKRGILAPKHVSLVCFDYDPVLEWCQPAVSHIRWESRHLVNRIVKWVDNITRGRDDRRVTFFKSSFVVGGTTGPAQVRRRLNF